MKNSRAIVAMVGIAFVLAIGAMTGRNANAAGPSPINLGTAANFSVLAGTAVTNFGATTTDRDVGVWSGSSVGGFTGPPNGTAGGAIHRADTTAQNAQSDLGGAYTVAANAPVTASHTELGGLTLVGGVYDSGGATLHLAGVLTLDGQNDPSSVWIFKASSDLITATGSYVNYINGASPCNIFWQVTSSATLGTGSTFVGTIMALTSVTLGDSITVKGRALARNGNVTLLNDHFLTSNCASAPLLIPPTRPPFTVAPSASPTPVPAPITTFTPAPAATATPIATAASSVGPTTAPTAAPVAAVPTAAPAAVAGTQKLPSTSTGDPAGPLTMLGIALTGIGVFLLRSRAIRHL
ncbi:MAG: ice-binding family protein [Chloroflexota bacterium]|nr:ice-binding family protein [Chloroflexota bacterium]